MRVAIPVWNNRVSPVFDTARLVLGMAYFNDKQYNSARKAFDAARKDKRSEKYASQWIKYLNSELDRQKTLKDDI